MMKNLNSYYLSYLIVLSYGWTLVLRPQLRMQSCEAVEPLSGVQLRKQAAKTMKVTNAAGSCLVFCSLAGHGLLSSSTKLFCLSFTIMMG